MDGRRMTSLVNMLGVKPGDQSPVKTARSQKEGRGYVETVPGEGQEAKKLSWVVFWKNCKSKGC